MREAIGAQRATCHFEKTAMVGHKRAYLWRFDRLDAPVHLDVVLPHEARLPGRVHKAGALLPTPGLYICVI